MGKIYSIIIHSLITSSLAGDGYTKELNILYDMTCILFYIIKCIHVRFIYFGYLNFIDVVGLRDFEF